jgi:hypothetical protein
MTTMTSMTKPVNIRVSGGQGSFRQGDHGDQHEESKKECLMKNSVVVYGPQGCGKTSNAEALLKRFGKKHLIDGWDGLSRLDDNVLALTDVEPPYGDDIGFVKYSEAMRNTEGSCVFVPQNISSCEVSGFIASIVLHDLKVNLFTFSNFPEVVVDWDNSEFFVRLKIGGYSTPALAVSYDDAKKRVEDFRSGVQADQVFIRKVQDLVCDLERHA